MIGEDYGVSLSSYTSPSPLGPFTKKQDLAPVFGLPADSTTFVDDDGTAYLIYNSRRGAVPQRFTYVYRFNDDYTDIVPSSMANTTTVMEGLWMVKRSGTYYLFGSPLKGYGDGDDFYLTAPAPLGPWTPRGLIAPAGSRTFDSQVFRGLEVSGPKGTAHVMIMTRWCNPYPPSGSCVPPFRNTTSIWLPLSFNPDGSIVKLKWVDNWTLDTDGAAHRRVISV